MVMTGMSRYIVGPDECRFLGQERIIDPAKNKADMHQVAMSAVAKFGQTAQKAGLLRFPFGAEALITLHNMSFLFFMVY